MSSPSKLALVVWLCAAACGGRGCGDSSGPPSGAVEIRVDDPDLDYVYRTRRGRLETAASLADIPPTLRGAVMIHHPTMPVTRRHDGGTVYVANLLSAAPDDTIRAERSTREGFAMRSADLRRARRLARLVHLASRQFIEFRPDSERETAADRARETFDDILPTLRPPASERDTPTDAGRGADSTDASRPHQKEKRP